MTDAEALTAIKAGNQDGLRVLYQRHREKCIKYAYKHLQADGSQVVAADLYQDAILAFYQNVSSGKLVELWVKTETYLIQIMRNQWLGRQRQHQRRLLTQLPEVVDGEHADLTRQRLRRALAKVDEKCRALLTYRHFDGLPYAAIVELTTYNSADAIRNVIVRCRKRLRSLYQQEPELPYRPEEDEEVDHLDKV